jgi:response regulator RpfG family c-di-GMP phosphodiesterase
MSGGENAAHLTVTVVDDEPVVQDVLVRAARAWNYDCQAAANAEQALELLERRPTTVVVTDLRMPGRGGVWLVREIRKRWPEVAVIVLTAGHDAEAAQQCLEAGADQYFVKPVRLDELRHALETTRRTQVHRRAGERIRQRLERAVRRQTRRVRHTFLSAIDSLVRAMEERDPYTAGHSRRVRGLALRLASALGLEATQQRRLSLAAKLHDIGKVGIPEAILHKSGPLTPAESLVVREHPVIGERILAPIIRRREVLAAIRGPHERLDGQGSPDGLKGEQIPLLARVIAVADYFDALTTARPYRAPLPVEEALASMQAVAGSHLEPAFVEAFVALIRRDAASA